MFTHLIKYKIKTQINTLFKTKNRKRYYVALFFGFWILFIIIQKGVNFFNLFNQFQTGKEIALNLIHIWVFAIFVFIFFTGLSNAISTLFTSTNLPLLLSAPIKRKTIFNYKLLEGIFINSYIYFFVGIPIFIAYGIAFEVNPFFYLAVILVSASILLIPTALSFLISMFVIKIMPAKRAKDLAGAVNGIIFIAIWLGFNFIKVSSFDRSSVDFNPASMDVLKKVGNNIIFNLSPTELGEKVLINTVNNQYLEALISLVPLFLITAVVYFLCVSMAENIYYSGWSSFQETITKDKGKKDIRLKKTGLPILKYDIKLIFRDTRILTQTVFQAIFAIAIPVILLRDPQNFPDIGSTTAPGIISISLILPFVLVALLVSQTTSRLIPLSGKSFWIIKVSPFPIKRFLYEKFILGYINTVIFVLIVVFITFFMFKASFNILPVIILLGLELSIGITAIGIFFGAIMPKFDWDHPKRMLQPSGNILNVISNVVYVILFFIIFHIVFYLKEKFLFEELTAYVLGFLLCTVITFVLFKISITIGKNNLSKMEWKF